MNFTLRKANEDDFEIIYKINRDAYREYVSQIWGWDEEFQYKYFMEHLEFGKVEVIMVENTAAGFISVDRRDDMIFGESIAILSEYRSKGIGTKIIKGLIAEAKQRKQPLCIQVFKVNGRARSLYEQLGFIQYGENERHYKYRMLP